MLETVRPEASRSRRGTSTVVYTVLSCPHCPALTQLLLHLFHLHLLQEHIEKIKNLLVPNSFSNASVAQELEDYGTFNPLWAAPAVLKQMPPITLQARAGGCH